MDKRTAKEIEKNFEQFTELRDKICNVLEGREIGLVLPALTALLAEIAFDSEVSLEHILKAVVTSITMKYASEMPNEDEPIH